MYIPGRTGRAGLRRAARPGRSCRPRTLGPQWDTQPCMTTNVDTHACMRIGHACVHENSITLTGGRRRRRPRRCHGRPGLTHCGARMHACGWPMFTQSCMHACMHTWHASTHSMACEIHPQDGIRLDELAGSLDPEGGARLRAELYELCHAEKMEAERRRTRRSSTSVVSSYHYHSSTSSY